MADDATVLSEMSPQPAADPDAQTTVNDFLDYTEYFPSDLVRSLRLISDLDANYDDATDMVHQLAKTYGRLPDIPASERPDPAVLRRDIAAALERAVYSRESTLAEATRLYEVAERHCRRIAIIKTKLQALPQPPSRDPTPVPVSPQASRSLARPYDRTPRLHLHFDASRHGASRPRDRNRKSHVAFNRGHSLSESDESDDESIRSTIDVDTRRLKLYTDRGQKQPKQRSRQPGAGTNVHSSIAGISTSNALARLSPPPPDARPGSRFAPWFKLTEYEMAVLRKQMKKNAIWCPSDTMIRRELEKKNRGHAAYDKEKARCEATGEEFLDEDPDAPAAPKATPAAPAVSNDGVVAVSAPIEPIQTPVEPPNTVKDDTATVNKGMKLNEAKEAKRAKRESQREQALRHTHQLEEATRKIEEAASSLKELTFDPDNINTALGPRRASIARSMRKRKREASPTAGSETPTARTREASTATQDSSTRPPQPKRIRLPSLQTIGPASMMPSAGLDVSPHPSASALSTPVAQTPVPIPDLIKTTTVQVPLAPAGPGTPKSAAKPSPKASRQPTPAQTSPTISVYPLETSEPVKSPIVAAPPQLAITAASSRPRRESVAPKAVTPPESVAQHAKMQKSPTPVLEETPPAPAYAVRPRSARGHVPTPKAQSEEPKPNEAAKPSRELRRHSIFSQSTVAAPTRASSRRKPPPKGDMTAGEEGQKTVMNVKRTQSNKNKKKNRADDNSELIDDADDVDDADPDEPRYCICDKVSFGQMILCDNHCERQWFHLKCVDMTPKDIPARRAKWYCPECRAMMGVDAYGNPPIPPPLPGRRANR